MASKKKDSGAKTGTKTTGAKTGGKKVNIGENQNLYILHKKQC